MNNAFTGQPLNTYKMHPIKRPDGAPVIQKPRNIPVLGPVQHRVLYKIVAIKDTIATITDDMNPPSGELDVRNVDVSSLGRHSVFVGDVLSYSTSDTRFLRPLITHRFHQLHQHPARLVSKSE
jgi:hypothetical protein